MDKKYGAYLDPVKNPDGTVYYPMCPNHHDYLMGVEEIMEKLETELVNEYYSWFKQRKAKITIGNKESNSELFYFLKGKVYNSSTYKDIEKKLDKHFVYSEVVSLYDDD